MAIFKRKIEHLEAKLAEVVATSVSLDSFNYSRATVVSGSRSSDRKGFLDAIQLRALEAGWLTVRDRSTPGFIDRLVSQQLDPMLDALLGQPGANAPRPVGLLNHIIAITTASPGRGLLLLTDGRGRNRREMEEVAIAFQHAIRERLEVAFVLTGRPSTLRPILSGPDSSASFLNRALRITLISSMNVARDSR